ncbi:MAG: hypothetical protein EOO17_06120 [Chloroflexi bacterium]|nr:MAG: hypothetical protein EOO17_06120 [Chloroflexota bacterium]
MSRSAKPSTLVIDHMGMRKGVPLSSATKVDKLDYDLFVKEMRQLFSPRGTSGTTERSYLLSCHEEVVTGDVKGTRGARKVETVNEPIVRSHRIDIFSGCTVTKVAPNHYQLNGCTYQGSQQIVQILQDRTIKVGRYKFF